MPVSEQAFKTALAALPAGVTVITTASADGERYGATVSAFCSISLRPPLIMVSIDARARTAVAIRERGAFAAHIIGYGSEDLAFRFASHTADKFSGLTVGYNERGVPLLEDCPLRLECSLYAEHPGGDHVLFLGQVEDATVTRTLPHPVAWYERGFRTLHGPFSDEVLASDQHWPFSAWLFTSGHRS